MAYSLRSIIKGSSIYTAGRVLTRAIGFFLIPIYTRFLTPDDYGIIGVLNVIVLMMGAVFSLGGYQAQTRFYHDFSDDRQKVGELLFSINVLLVGVGFFVCTVLTIFGKPILALVIKSPNITFYPFLVIIIWTGFLNIINQLVPNYYVATKRYTYCAVLWIVQFVTSASLIILFVVGRREGALGSIKGVLLGHILFFLAFYWRYAKNFVWRLNPTYVKAVLAMGLPIVAHTTATAAMVSIDRLILERMLTLTDVGLYTLGYKFGVVLSIIVVSINQAWMPNYYELMKQERSDKAREVKRVFALWMTAIGAVCVIGSVWAKEAVQLLTTEAYFESAVVIPMIFLGFFFQGVYFFMIGPIFYFKKTIFLPIITVTAALANIALNFALIPRFGILGAAFATTLAFMLLAVLAYFLGRRYFDPRFDRTRLSMLITIVCAVAIGAHFWNPNWLVKLAIIAGYLAAGYMLFPSYLKPVARRALSYVGYKS